MSQDETNARAEAMANAERLAGLVEAQRKGRATAGEWREINRLSQWFDAYREKHLDNAPAVFVLRTGEVFVIGGVERGRVHRAAPIRFLTNAETGLAVIEALVGRQRADRALWVKAGTVGEQRLQRELAELHRAIELSLGVALADQAHKVQPMELPGHDGA